MRYSQWQVVVASETVEAEIRALPAGLQARYLRLVDLIEEYGPQTLGMPHVRPLEGKSWELRMKGQGRNRPSDLCRRGQAPRGDPARICKEDAKDPPARVSPKISQICTDLACLWVPQGIFSQSAVLTDTPLLRKVPCETNILRDISTNS